MHRKKIMVLSYLAWGINAVILEATRMTRVQLIAVIKYFQDLPSSHLTVLQYVHQYAPPLFHIGVHVRRIPAYVFL